MQIVSEEESKRWKAEIQRLRASESAEDRIVAILMDLEIGGSGNSGDPARAKARAICELTNLQKDDAIKVERQRCIDVVLSVFPTLPADRAAWKECQTAIYQRIRLADYTEKRVQGPQKCIKWDGPEDDANSVCGLPMPCPKHGEKRICVICARTDRSCEEHGKPLGESWPKVG